MVKNVFFFKDMGLISGFTELNLKI